MTNMKKQLKITKLFRKGATKLPEECDDLQEEVQQLERKLREKQNELFQLQRNSYRHKLSPPKKKEEIFIRPKKIVLTNSVENLKRNLELMAMLTSTEVQSYVAGDHCCVVFHMQHDTLYEVKHGLKINMKNGANDIAASPLPLGFDLNGVLQDFDNVMKPDCLGAVRKALVAYYDRLEQFQQLKKLVNIEAELFKTLDGSHVEITLVVHDETAEEDDQYGLVVYLDYRVYDIRPKKYAIKELDLPEDAAELIREQCAVFKKKPLNKAFHEAFIDGVGRYKLVQQLGVRQEKPRKKRFRPNRHNCNDDTFQPEDCSDQGEEDDMYCD